jgi:hypothetical protein
LPASKRPKPARFAVGITGHRLNQLPPEAHPAIEAAIGYAMALAQAAAEAANGAPVAAALVSAIAEGADRFAAQRALRMKWRLETPLPFTVDRYVEDFEQEDSQLEFRTLLARSKRVEVSPAAHQPSPAPYAAVGEMIVAWSDVLIAVWNGAPPKGPGGTAEVAARMADLGRPVIWIPSQTGGPLRLIVEGPQPPLNEQLQARIARVARPEAMRVA